MKRKNVLVVSILTLTVLASSTAMAFAATDTTTSATAKGLGHNGDIRAELNLTDTQKTLLHESRTNDLKEALANLVKAGTFTQAEADSLISNIPPERAGKHTGPSDRDKGQFQNLTEKQRTALESELQNLKASSLKELVSDGTITQAQADILAKQGPGKMGDHGKGDKHR